MSRIKATTDQVPGAGAPTVVTPAAHGKRPVDPNRRVRYERRVCPAGGPGNDPVRAADCATARTVCQSAGHPGGTAVWTWVGPAEQPQSTPSSAWAAIGYRCRVPGEPEPGLVPVLSQRQLRELPIPAGHASIEPGSGPVLINVATNVYVKAPTVTLGTTVLGRRVEVEVTADTYVWNFGDGETLTTRDPGGPYPNMTTTHTYRHTGKRTITLTTIYTGRFHFVGDTEWLPAEGTAEVPSPPATIDLIETRAVLVN